MLPLHDNALARNRVVPLPRPPVPFPTLVDGAAAFVRRLERGGVHGDDRLTPATATDSMETYNHE
jgi:hypothetical protein